MLGIVTGLAAEARLARPLGSACAGGGTPQGAAEAATNLIAQGATALISFGLAGGLNPALPAGTLIIPGALQTPAGAKLADAVLVRRLGGPRHTLYAGIDIAVTRADKKALYDRTGADAIDLESGAVADVAAAAGVPFAVLRAICDPADTDLPPAAMIALDARGAITVARVAGAVLRQPAQLPALLRLAAHAAAASAALRQRVAQIRSE